MSVSQTGVPRRSGVLSTITRPLLSCYYPLGDPEVPVEMLDIYADCGVDVLEIGMSSPDPFLDGPDVSASMARADRGQARRQLDAVLDQLARQRHAPKPLLMCYADADHPGRVTPQFWAGLSSVLVVAREADPVAAEIEACAKSAGVPASAFVPLPLKEAGLDAARRSAFYVMLQASAGKTGPRAQVDPDAEDRIARLRAAGVEVPILLGFGISNGAQAGSARALGADGVIVGSQVLRAAFSGPQALAATLTDLRGGLDA
ncbi:tryptophan synthase subunit alpha [Roseicyclus sp. F158]|uniref:tryptophan synthase n=1 Tax=Tropicimonas omnivorans TaxID=3075590 RepID=A0ABU3DFA9_9RHOB|nr:tryptophan synthase subunit alpha [Roseicyclus sp. F158]MDT0682401.1 tryptophan synthase subunit alpha [Roseicyclus sp. F158]